MSDTGSFTTTILIAEPDQFQQKVYYDTLKDKYRLIFAESLNDTFSKLVTYHPAILLLEVNQPDGDGLNLIQQIRREPSLKSMIVACVTNRNGVADKIKGFRAGSDDYIIKPINLNTFAWRMVLLGRVRNLG